MRIYEAPAKLNLSLHVRPPRGDGYHPLESLVQTIGWCDRLEVEEGEREDSLEIEGADLEVEGNLVLKAVAAVRATTEVVPMAMRLVKSIPVEAGLGGGSSDAAAALLAAGNPSPDLAATVGADVPLFLTGGSLVMSGIGDVIEPFEPPLSGFAIAVVVPEFWLSTVDAYRRWDELEGPQGGAVPPGDLPPPLRDGMPMRNDLLPAALSVEPRLGDFMADVRAAWGTSVALTGSGSACFGYFGTPDEAHSAASAVSDLCREAKGVELRPHGVKRV
jgi:4-diphosphocytidyl-2-C-methyl-D-erythritol kinase